VLSEQRLEHPAGPYILVDSTEEAMKKIAAFYRRSLDIKVVGITGKRRKDQHKRDDRVRALRKIPCVKDRGKSEQ